MTTEKKIPHPVDVYVGSRVRLQRITLGISQDKLGKALNLTFQQIQKYERGANRIGASRIYQLSTILGVPVQFFYDKMPKEIANNTVPLGQKSNIALLPNRKELEIMKDVSGLSLPQKNSVHAVIKVIKAANSIAVAEKVQG